MKAYTHTKTRRLMFKVALLIITKTWTQSKFLPTGEWISKMWQMHTMEYYLTIKRNKVLKLAIT